MAKQEGTVSSPGYTEVTIQSQRASGGEKKFQEIFQKANNMGKFCPVRDIIARVSDKWSLLAIYALGGYGTLRFNELKHRIGDISQRMLTVTLRNLEKDGLITRRIFAEVPPRVEYALTPLGTSLMEQVTLLADWACSNSEQILKHRNKRSKI